MSLSDDAFLTRVRDASTSVLGNSVAGRAVRQLCEVHAEQLKSLATDRAGGSLVLAIIGATGQGKSWLLRQFVQSSTVANAIPSGNNLNEATEKITWVGPVPPTNIDVRYEQYLHCSASQMFSLGSPYLLVDSPGSTDHRKEIAEISQLVLSMASVMLVVVRHDQIRSHSVDALAAASEGSLVVPVINAITPKNDSVQADVESFMARLRAVAPLSVITTPVLIPDFEVIKRPEAEVGQAALGAIAAALASELAQGDTLGRRANRRTAMNTRFRSALHAHLHDQLPGLSAAVNRLHEAAKRLPEEIAASLVGGSASLRAAIRSRLRASLMTDTPGLWFPYRTMLSLFSITSGAWDRVVLSLAGSLPSLVMATYSGIRNFTRSGESAGELRDGIRRRSAAAVADRLGPLAVRFRYEIDRLNQPGQPPNTAQPPAGEFDPHRSAAAASLAGIDSLQERSQQIIDESIAGVSPSRGHAIFWGLVGTLMFWSLLVGPIMALYRGYIQASVSSVNEGLTDLERFPRLDFSMFMTSVGLSALPLAVFVMFVLSWVQRRRQVERAEQQIRQEHQQAIRQLQSAGILRLEWDDPLLADAEFLLSAGCFEREAVST